MSEQLIRVLLVDDDEDDFIITHEVLTEIQGWRFNGEWVATYEAALEAIKAGNHDVGLVDYRLGRHTGLELLCDATEIGCNIPLILLTGQGDREIDLAAMRAGAADYLTKGQIDAAVLERSIRYAIERKRANDERAIIQDQLIHRSV